MTLVEAIKSGRPFRRPDWGAWFFQKNGRLRTTAQFHEDEDVGASLGCDDILAEDWLVKPTPAEFWLNPVTMEASRVFNTDSPTEFARTGFIRVREVEPGVGPQADDGEGREAR